ncbi:hypothetical protein KIPB_009608, partial [Kipferlia bialata]|eukprot:g9608.t1
MTDEQSDVSVSNSFSDEAVEAEAPIPPPPVAPVDSTPVVTSMPSRPASTMHLDTSAPTAPVTMSSEDLDFVTELLMVLAVVFRAQGVAESAFLQSPPKDMATLLVVLARLMEAKKQTPPSTLSACLTLLEAMLATSAPLRAAISSTGFVVFALAMVSLPSLYLEAPEEKQDLRTAGVRLLSALYTAGSGDVKEFLTNTLTSGMVSLLRDPANFGRVLESENTTPRLIWDSSMLAELQ